jgi:ATP synthase protein I
LLGRRAFTIPGVAVADEPKDGPKPPSSKGELVRVYDAAWQLVAAVGLGAGVGYALDRRLGTAPWALVVGALLGSVAGFVAFFRSVLRQGNSRSNSSRP